MTNHTAWSTHPARRSRIASIVLARACTFPWCPIQQRIPTCPTNKPNKNQGFWGRHLIHPARGPIFERTDVIINPFDRFSSTWSSACEIAVSRSRFRLLTGGRDMVSVAMPDWSSTQRSTKGDEAEKWRIDFCGKTRGATLRTNCCTVDRNIFRTRRAQMFKIL